MAHPLLTSLSWIRRATTPTDGLIAFSTLGMILYFLVAASSQGTDRLEIYKENQLLQSLSLNQTTEIQVAGRLGPVTIEIKPGAARLREFDSPRMIGTRSGWIRGGGEMAICLPCGLFIRIPARQTPPHGLDAVAQ
ncbi:hypothetical protein Mmc1_0236 [Magnetococcus marinus MC-1]|uniref:Uncharacterized protein n=1 Tax=Magnetococcus marinus (strain ATCC BAA-1437 / JCM 17883 / MC-1) TaxID=156889 RepID=A0L470_MAGMM|nr:NusG domain II-containing protein [Magnetococcus marinus]ABK42763.1 hypothetical protein Mmc1_0236 [Magnetococcus marinus MC-1]